MIDMLETAEVICQIFAAIIFAAIIAALTYVFIF